MARYSEYDTSKIYEAADAFRNKCLLSNGSLIFEEDSLWRPALLDSIHKAFVASPDEGDRSFIDKFRDQITPEGPEVICLAAELLAVYFLFPTSVGRVRKMQVVNEVLEWAGKKLPETHLLYQAFEHGIGSGGQGYNTRRPFELAFLIEFTKAWKALLPEQQHSAASDPWKFQKLIDSIENAESQQLRHMLLHMLFPDSYERIASGNHKRRVIAAFAGLVKDEHENKDQQLLSIRQGLEALMPENTLDFYLPPLKAAWYDSNESGLKEGASLEMIQYKKQLVLYGPPGTGKTYAAKHLAETIIHSSALASMGPAQYFNSQPAMEDALKSNIHRLQLHPAYSYEDFIRGLHISANGATEYRPGYLLRLIDAINQKPRESRLPHILILDEMNRTDLSRMLGECFSLLEDRNQTIELPAHNGEGEPFTLRIPDDLFVIGTMNLIDQSVEQIDFALRRRFLWVSCPFDKEALIKATESRWNGLKIGLDWSRVEADFRKLARAAEILNEEIRNSSQLGPQYEIGHTYLLDVVVFLQNFLGPKPTRKHNYLWNRRGEALEPVTQIWNMSIKPLLEQYLSGLAANDGNAELKRLSKVFLEPTGDA